MLFAVVDELARIDKLVYVAEQLERLEEAAASEADGTEGRLSGPKTPLARKKLGIALSALYAAGGRRGSTSL